MRSICPLLHCCHTSSICRPDPLKEQLLRMKAEQARVREQKKDITITIRNAGLARISREAAIGTKPPLPDVELEAGPRVALRLTYSQSREGSLPATWPAAPP